LNYKWSIIDLIHHSIKVNKLPYFGLVDETRNAGKQHVA